MRNHPLKFVYILQSLADPDRHYVGMTSDLDARIAKHNSGAVSHTSKYRPWGCKTFIGFADEKRAVNFEKYLKTASGRAFSKKRL